MSRIQNFDRWASNLLEDTGELIDEHKEAADPRRFRTYEGRPVAFIQEVLNGEPWSAQEEIAEAVRDHPLVVCRAANGVGKDWLAARLALYWVYACGGLALVTGPTYRQVTEIVMREVARAFGQAENLPGELFQSALRLSRESSAGILAFTSSSAGKLTGYHGARVMGIVTEGQDVEPFVYDALMACAVGEEDRILSVGNPTRPTGMFYELCEGDGWQDLAISAREHPNVVEGKQVIPGGPTQAWIERQAEQWGEDSSTFRARVEGEFPDAGEDSVFRRSWLDEAAERKAEGTLQAPEATKAAGVDVARGGDQTVVCIREGGAVTRLEEFSFADTTLVESKVAAVLREEGFTTFDETEGVNVEDQMEKVVVDVGGPGGGVADHLKEMRFAVCEFRGGDRAVEERRFRNARAESYWMVRRKLEHGTVTLPHDEELFRELLATRWFTSGDGRVQLESKNDIRGRLGRSPDRADALTMCFYSEYLDSQFGATGLQIF